MNLETEIMTFVVMGRGAELRNNQNKSDHGGRAGVPAHRGPGAWARQGAAHIYTFVYIYIYISVQ